MTADLPLCSTQSGGLYVHLPFCPYVCPYCDFAKWPLRRSQARALPASAAYARSLQHRPLRRARCSWAAARPTRIRPQHIAELIGSLRERFGLPCGRRGDDRNESRTARCAASDVFETYARAGITRVSFGVQSFVPGELETLGRRHTRRRRRVSRGRRARRRHRQRLARLMFAVPGQTPASWQAFA